MTTKTLTAEQRDLMASVIASTEARIEELESYFSVTMIDDCPFVVVMETMGNAALRILDRQAGTFNFSAMGRDASQFSRARAEKIVAEINTPNRPVRAMPKHDFFAAALESARECLAIYQEALAK